MKFLRLFLVYTLLSLALVASHAVTPDDYWKSVLPNSPMPKAIKDILVYTPGWTEEKYSMDGLGNDGVQVGPFAYNYAASADQLKDNPNVAFFFLENDLNHGKEMNECEDKGIEGEEKYCATSLESMVDFSTSKLGKKVKAISTEVNTNESTPLQTYKIEGAKKLAADKAVVCHKHNYAYAVFYCHKTVSTRVNIVSLVGVDGTKAKAVAVCHTDTSRWNPEHLAFQVLKVKPGSVPVCHFLPQNHVVWFPYQ
ncbi:hypothetical protein LXL04_032523 [Taraxacum kok-saghyz]